MEPPGWGGRPAPGADWLRAGRPAGRGQVSVSSRLSASVRTSRIGDAQLLEILFRPSALFTSLMACRSFAIALLSSLLCALPLFPSARETRESAAVNFFWMPGGTDSVWQTEGLTELPNAQLTPSLPVFTASAGHAAPEPVQFSAMSQASTAARHTVLWSLKASAGQSALDPVQVSATSQSPAAARHTVVWSLKPSAGHAVFVPSQTSATSQSPAAARHSVPALPAGCWHVSLVPSHVSVVHGLPSSVHAVPLWCFASAGHAAFAPSQTSATSHSPAAARHGVPALPAACWQVSLVPSQVSVVHGLPSSVHTVPLWCFASAGHAAFAPSQTSATSHSPT